MFDHSNAYTWTRDREEYMIGEGGGSARGRSGGGGVEGDNKLCPYVQSLESQMILNPRNATMHPVHARTLHD